MFLVLRCSVKNSPFIFLSIFLVLFFILLTLSKTLVCGLMQIFLSQNTIRKLVNPASSKCTIFVGLDSILDSMKWPSFQQMPWLLAIWTIIMSTPLGGGYIIFAFFAVRCPMSDVRCPMSDVRCPASGVRCPASRMVSAHLKEKY